MGMKMKKNSHTSIKIIALLILLVILGMILMQKLKVDYIPEEYSNTYISIDEVKSELAFTVYTGEEWDEFFAVYEKEYMTNAMLTDLLEKLGILEQIELFGRTKQHAVSREEWSAVYEQMLDYLDMDQKVQKQTLLVLDTMDAASQIVLITNLGDFYTTLPVGYFEKWKAYSTYVIKDECIGICAESKEEAVIENTYIKDCGTDKITFLFAGASYEKEMEGLSEDSVSGVCDLVFVNQTVQTIRMKQDMIEGEMLSYDDAEIEIEGYGKISHRGKLPVYQTYGEVAEKSISDIILGNMKVKYVTAGTEVCAILIGQPAEITSIRVLLLAEDGTNFKQEVYLKCDYEAAIKYGDNVEQVPGGTLISVAEYINSDNPVTFSLESELETAKTYLCDADGNAISNGYFGSMEVRCYEAGYTVVNQLPFEAYLYAVVPSEMPSSYMPEALKAQAICARSYAYRQLLKADLAEYGAHINDSTSYQVYNKVAQTSESIAAVEATRGKVLTYQGDVLEAFYFSTSMGYTDTAAVWNVENIEQYGYLKKACLNTDAGMGGAETDLSKEDTFSDYITKAGTGYDSDIKYYRWFASADYSEQTEQINAILENRRSISNRNVLYYETDGKTMTDSLKGFGKIKSLSVEERSKSGSILTLVLHYQKGMVRVKTEYNIRKVLGCGIEKIVYADSSESTSATMLPSAFCTVKQQKDGTYVLSGGGYGHGLGMSQNGANGMAKAGMSCEDILNYFYQNILIENIE